MVRWSVRLLYYIAPEHWIEVATYGGQMVNRDAEWWHRQHDGRRVKLFGLISLSWLLFCWSLLILNKYHCMRRNSPRNCCFKRDLFLPLNKTSRAPFTIVSEGIWRLLALARSRLLRRGLLVASSVAFDSGLRTDGQSRHIRLLVCTDARSLKRN